MKIRKHISLLLMLFATLTLFSGCNLRMTMMPQMTKPPSITAPESTEGTSSQQTEPSETIEPTRYVPLDAWTSGKPVKASFSESCDVTNGIYASCGNFEYTSYEKIQHNIDFTLICTSPLPGDAAIIIDTTSEYEASIIDITPSKNNLAVYPVTLWDYVECGLNLKEYYKISYESAAAIFEYNNCHSEDPVVLNQVKEKCINAQKAFSDYSLKNIRPYDNAKKAFYNSPWSLDFRYYRVRIKIEAGKSERLNSVTLTANGMQRVIPIGEIRLEYGSLPQTSGTGVVKVNELSINGMTGVSDAIQSLRVKDTECDAWSPNNSYIDIYFKATTSITLKDLEAKGRTIQTTHGELLIINGESIMQLSWTPGTEIPIRKGEYVILRVFYDSPYLHQAECCIKDALMVKYNDADGGGYIAKNIDFHRERPAMEVYLWAFKGLDTRTNYYDTLREYQQLMAKLY